MKRMITLLMALVMILGLSMSVFAADSTITFKGAAEGFAVQPGSQYTTTDLFDGFKNVMPGDKLTETITITNDASDCDYIKLYMKAVVHDENNALSEEVAKTETLATMQDFLAQLTMRIYNGDQLIYEASPDQAGALADNVELGTLYKGDSLNLKVELDVPIEMGNEYANRVGEVDWVFLAECTEGQKLTVHKVWDDCKDHHRPKSITVYLMRNGKVVEEVELNRENHWTYTWDDLDSNGKWSVVEDVPHGYEATYKRDDNRILIINKLKERPVKPEPCDPVDLTVKKVWSDENDKNGIRPDFVSVTLYDGEKAVEKVILNERNNWTHKWNHLDGDGEWYVLETGIPKGYVPSYSYKGDVVTITNTATLIQTGQLNWPILVLGGLGALMLFAGAVVIFKKRKPENA